MSAAIRPTVSNTQWYDEIGATYTTIRRTEPRIAAQVWAALGDAHTVLNVLELEEIDLGLRLLIA
jgi:hypothetical protein